MFIYLSRHYTREEPDLFVSDNKISNESKWIYAIRLNASIPHDLVCHALPKMDSNSKVIFMTTGISLSIRDKNNDFSHLAIYAGTKAAQNFLMRALAFHNDKNVVMCSISTHFPDESTEEYVNKVEEIFHLINAVDISNNGQIVVDY
jgi:short-subunit dehydrogenase